MTIFDSVGFALEDYSALRFLHRLLHERPEQAQRIDLLPQLDDPKNLFGKMLAAPGVRRLQHVA